MVEKRQKNKMQKLIPLACAVLLFTSGCGSRGETQEAEDIEIFYHADDGEFDLEYGYGTSWETPLEEVKEGKVVVTLVALDMTGGAGLSPLTLLVNQFNRENEKYWIELETCGAGAELETMWDRLSVEIGAGDGYYDKRGISSDAGDHGQRYTGEPCSLSGTKRRDAADLLSRLRFCRLRGSDLRDQLLF